MTRDFYSLWDTKTGPPTTNGASPATNGNGHAARLSGDTSYGETALNAECDAIVAAPVGTRNDQLNRSAFNIGQLVAGGEIDESDAIAGMTLAARIAGLSETEIGATITSGLTAGTETPRTAPPRPEPTGGTVLPKNVTDAATVAFWPSRDTLQTIHTWARARMASPWAVLGVVLARVIAATDHRIVIPPITGGVASLNMFVGIVGTSGAGKGAAEAVAAEAINVGPLAEHRPGSGEGIAHSYMRRIKGGDLEQHETNCLFSITEIDTLSALGSRQSSTLLPELRSAWSGEALGFAYADPAKRMPVPKHHYRLCLVTGIQPARAATLLQDSDGGTPQRFLWLPATDRDAPDVAPDCPAPIRWTHPQWTLTHVDRHRISVCATATDTIRAARLARLRGAGDALDGHALLCRLKTAVALALLERRLAVNDDDWRLAGIIQDVSDATRTAVASVLSDQTRAINETRALAEAARSVVVSERLAELATKRVLRRLVRIVTEAGNDGIGHNELRHEMAKRDRPTFDDAVVLAVRSGQIESIPTPHGTRYAVSEK